MRFFSRSGVDITPLDFLSYSVQDALYHSFWAELLLIILICQILFLLTIMLYTFC